MSINTNLIKVLFLVKPIKGIGLSAIKEVTKFCSSCEWIAKSSPDIAAHLPLA